MKKSNFNIIVAAILYVVGFVGWVVFLSLLKNQYDTTAWLYGIGAGFGVLLFCISNDIKKF